MSEPSSPRERRRGSRAIRRSLRPISASPSQLLQAGRPDMGEPVLHVEGLKAGYGEVQVLWGISLAVARGGMTTLVGANGAGKTTSLRAVTGNIRPFGGRVWFAGEDVTRLPTHAKAARGLVLVP